MSVFDVEEFFHDEGEVGVAVDAAEGVVDGEVELIDFVVDGVGLGVGGVGDGFESGHSGLGGGEVWVAAGGGACDDGGGDSSSEGAGLVGAGDAHLVIGDVGVDLHEHGVFVCDAAGADDGMGLDAELLEAFEDGASAEGGGFDEGAVDFCAGGVEGLAEEEAGEALVNEDIAIAVVPVESEEAGLSGFKFFCFSGELGMESRVALTDALDPPAEDVADGGLAGFDAEEAWEDGAMDDAADAWDFWDGAVGWEDGAVAGGGAEDFDEDAFCDAGADGPVVDIEFADGNGDAWGEGEFFCPRGGEVAGGLGCVVGGLVETVAELSEGWVEGGEEFFIGEATEVCAVEGFVSCGADAAADLGWVGDAAEDGGEPIGEFNPGVSCVEDGGVCAEAMEDFAPEPFGGVGIAAACDPVGAGLAGFGGDFFGFCPGGVVFPKPALGVEVVAELGKESEGGIGLVNGDGAGAGGIDADADDRGILEV